MSYPPPTGTVTRYRAIREGPAGALDTLILMADMIRAPSPFADQFAEALLLNVPDLTAACAATFGAVRDGVTFQEDRVSATVADEIRTPDVMLWALAGNAPSVGDCDDQTVLLGAICRRLGAGVALVAVSLDPTGQLEHVYAEITTPEGTFPADPIMDGRGGRPRFGFGQSIPPGEITARLRYPVV